MTSIPARSTRWLVVLGWAAVLGVLTAQRLAVNAQAPVQRDGAFFLFMAQNIAHGQPPYWATFETKNPLVEYVWAAAYRLAPGNPGLVQVARVTEHLWIFVTALCLAALCLAARRRGPPGPSEATASVLACVTGAVYLLLVTHFQVVDDGFNMAIYTTLPEAAGVALLLRPRPDRGTWAVALGVAVFGAWFVKQTSLFTLALPAATAVLMASERRAWARGLALAGGVAAALAFAFVLALQASGTLDEYWLGAVRYKSLIASRVTLPAFLQNLQDNLVAPRSPHEVLARFHTVLLYHVPPALLAWWVAVLWSRRSTGHASSATVAVLLAWFLGATLQAVLSLLFFRHYFISAIGPALVAVGALCLQRRIASRVAVTTGLLIGAALVAEYRGLGEIARRRSAEAPVTQTVAEIESVVPRQATVFLWGGLPHLHLARSRPSDYPQNMWWPYILEDVTPAARDSRLQAALAPNPPDFIVELFETYPADQALVPVRLDAALLRTWTGRDYVLVLETAPKPGRYGAPARVFRRVS